MRYAVGEEGAISGLSEETLGLWTRVAIIREFPQYRLGELSDCDDLPDLLKAMQLTDLARQAAEANRG